MTGLPLVFEIYGAAVLVPSIAVTVRRLHDTGKAGTSIFIALVPVLGWIVLVYWLLQPGSEGKNVFGPMPSGQL